jgi:NAD+ synthase (glutamine-hydrolysing)
MLMALSNKQGYILLNTSNKSEAAVGYGTLYGDMAGAIGPIADLYKVEVYDLARHINREKEIIPENIILKAPSAELRPDQKDSDSLPPYEVMDAILTRIVEEGHSLDEIIDAGFDFDTVHYIARMLQRAEFKRRQCAPPLRLSPRPFESCYVLPMINKFIL